MFFMTSGPHVHSHPVCFSLLSNSFSDAMQLRETEMVVDALSCMSHMKQEKRSKSTGSTDTAKGKPCSITWQGRAMPVRMYV